MARRSRRSSSDKSTKLSRGRFGERMRGDAGDFLVVPSGDAHYFDGTPIRVVGLAFASGPHGLLLPAKSVQAPQPIDLITTYITYQEVFGGRPQVEYVAGALGRVERDTFVTGLAGMLGAYEAMNQSRKELDLRLAQYWFKAEGLAEIDSRVRSGSALVAPQTLLLLMEWALALAPETVEPGTQGPHLGSLILAVQDGLGYQRGDADGGEADDRHSFAGETRSPLFREVVSSADFYADEDIATTLAHHHARWIRLSRELAGRDGAVDLVALFEEATGVTKDDFTAVGLTIWAQCEAHRRYPIPASALNSFALPRETVERALELFSATPERFAVEIRSLEQKFQTQWSFDVLRRFPLMRLANGDLVVLSKRLLIERLFGWLPIFDVVEGLKAAQRTKEAKRADGWLRALCEADALESLRSLAASRLFEQAAIQAAFGTDQHRNADAVIEYPDAFIVVEIETRQLKRETTIAGDPDELEADLHKGIVLKAEQLHSTISDLIANESALTGRDPLSRRRYVATLVLTEGFPVNPMTMTAVRNRLAERGLLTDPRIGPLHILSQEELDIVEAVAEQGGESLLDLLEAHERSTMRDMSLKNWLLTDPHRRTAPSRPKRLEQGQEAFWRMAIDRLAEANREPAS